MMTDECIKQMRQSQWISAQDRMPDVEGSYIICTDRGAVCSAHYYPQKSRWNNPYNGHVMCWQPFPEPPEHIEWINTVAIPRLESWGFEVIKARADKRGIKY